MKDEREKYFLTQRKNYRGGILFSAILLVSCCSMLLMMTLEVYQTTALYTAHTADYYLALVMKELFLSEYQVASMGEQGEQQYSLGKVTYEWSKPDLYLDVYLPTGIYEFEEKTQEVQNRMETSTDAKESP